MIADVLGSVHTFRKAEQSLDLLDYERSYFKNCVNGAFMPPEAMPLTWILRYETHIVVVLCSPERMHSLTVHYALFYRCLHRNLQNRQRSVFPSKTTFKSFVSIKLRGTQKVEPADMKLGKILE